MSVWWSCKMFSCWLSKEKLCVIMDSVEGAAKLTLPYLSGHILSMAPCNTEGKWNWNSLESEIIHPSKFFREQVASKLPKMLHKCSLINQPGQHPCEMDMCCSLHGFMHAESWACPGWCNNPAVMMRWEHSTPKLQFPCWPVLYWTSWSSQRFTVLLFRPH